LSISHHQRPPFGARLSVPLLVVILAAVAGGCASFKAPTWPWSKGDAALAATEAEVEKELGDDADSDVISSEYTSSTS